MEADFAGFDSSRRFRNRIRWIREKRRDKVRIGAELFRVFVPFICVNFIILDINW